MTHGTRVHRDLCVPGVGRRGEAASEHEQKKEIKADVLSPSSGIVALVEGRWADDVDKALSNADKTTTREVDPERADKGKATASSEG